MIIADLLDHAARHHGGHPALEDERRRLTYAELATAVDGLARGLRGLGLQPGDRVALLSRNRVEYTVAYLAIAAARLVAVPLNHRLLPEELHALLRDCEARAVLASADLAPRVDDAAPAVRIDLDGRTPGWLAPGDLSPAAAALERGEPDDVVVQMYTSGTTGRPKGAMLTQRALVANALVWAPEMPLRRARSRYLQVTPLFHVGGLAMSLTALAAAATVVLHDDFAPDRVARALAHDGITHALLVPTMLRWLLQEPAARGLAFPHLERLLYGASPIGGELLRAAADRLGCDFVQGYGLTETTAVLTVLRPDDHRAALTTSPHLLRSAGTAVLGTVVRVVDAAGLPLPAGEVGEVVARGPSITTGYWKQPEATAEAFRTGWFHTGDLGQLDEQGYLTLVDRLKDMIIVGGENVYPREIEQVLEARPEVTEVAVIGVPHPLWGEEALALVVAARPEPGLDRQLLRACRDKLAAYKCPARVQFVDALPRNAAGKVLKQALRDQWWQGRDRSI